MTENDKLKLEKIANDLNKRMACYHSSLKPTEDEVTIAWLLTIIAELQTALKFPFMTKEK